MKFLVFGKKRYIVVFITRLCNKGYICSVFVNGYRYYAILYSIDGRKRGTVIQDASNPRGVWLSLVYPKDIQGLKKGNGVRK